MTSFRHAYLLTKGIRFVDRDMIMRYLGSGPGHSRRGCSAGPHMQYPNDADIEADCEDPSEEECEQVQGSARRHNAHAAEEEEEWLDDDDDEEPPPDLSDDEDLPGNDEYTYALAGLTL